MSVSRRARSKKPPKPGLLKFSGPTEYALENLRNRVIYCQHFTAFNDPFEFWTDFREDIPDLETERERFIAAIRAWVSMKRAWKLHWRTRRNTSIH